MDKEAHDKKSNEILLKKVTREKQALMLQNASVMEEVKTLRLEKKNVDRANTKLQEELKAANKEVETLQKTLELTKDGHEHTQESCPPSPSRPHPRHPSLPTSPPHAATAVARAPARHPLVETPKSAP